jgi:hypothetical protein
MGMKTATKICKKCSIEKPLTVEFFKQIKRKTKIKSNRKLKDNNTQDFYWAAACRKCAADAQAIYHAANKENDSETKKKWYLLNKENVIARVSKRTVERRKEEPVFNLRTRISRSIASALKRMNGSKGGASCLDFLPYSFQELIKWISDKWEPWMNWNNYGAYRIDTWKDDDSSTWTWQLDHIKPHSSFYYTSMDCQEFRDCWALTNLRPLSAKQNVIDGDRGYKNRN